MISKSRLTKSLVILLSVGVLAGLGTIPATGAPSGAASDATPVTVPDDSSTTNYAGLAFIEAEFNDPGLDDPRSVAVSPDGAYVYVVGYIDDAIAVFQRDSVTGRLAWVQKKQDSPGVSLPDALDGAHAVAVSPDSAHVYVVSMLEDAVTVFERDINGRLGYVEAEKNGVLGVGGLDGACGVTVSPDGKHVYVTGCYEDAVAIFERDSTTGELTYAGMVQNGVSGVDGLNGARSVVVSSDGKHVYVAGELDDAVAIFERNSTSGALTYTGMVQDGTGGANDLDAVRSVAIDPAGSRVYVAGYHDDAVTVFERNSSSGALTFLAVAKEGVLGVDGLSEATGVAVSPDGIHCYATGALDDAVVTMQYLATPGPLLFYKGKKQDGVGGVEGLDYAYAVAVSPDGKHVYATGLLDDAVSVFSRDGITGDLTYVDVNRSAEGMRSPQAVAVSPDGNHVYAGGEDGSSLAVFGRESASGRLTFVEYKHEGDGDVVDGLSDIKSIAVSPDGAYVYVASYDDNALTVFDRNSTTGKLTFDEMKKDGVDSVDGLNGAHSVAVSPDGQYVYVTGSSEDALAIFARTVSGDLLLWGVHKDGDYEVDGLDCASAVAAGPGGEYVYVTGYCDDALAVFQWKTVNFIPVLTYVDMKKDGVGGVNGLNGASSVAVSTDGEHVYVTGREEDALAHFRWTIFGALTFHSSKWDGGGVVDGLYMPQSVAVNPINDHIYVASYDNALAVFRRDDTTEELVYLGVKQDDGFGNGPIGLCAASSVAVSPDGQHVYVTGKEDEAVTVFERMVFFIYFPGTFNDYNPEPRPPR